MVGRKSVNKRYKNAKQSFRIEQNTYLPAGVGNLATGLAD